APIERIEIQGLETIGEGFVRRIIKTRAGQNYVRRQVQEDVRELWRSRKFLNVFADTSVEDGQVVVVLRLQERPEILSVEIEGNKRFSDEDLFKELGFFAGSVLDVFEINQGLENILQKYKEKGYYYAEVELDRRALQAEARVVYRIIEGPRVKVRKIRFEGARSYPEPRLRLMVRTQTYLWVFRTGALDEEQTDRDARELQTFYRNEGYLDARVGYRLDFDSVSREDLTVVFVIEEGPRYRIEDFRVRGNEAFTSERIRSVMELEPGDVLRDEALRADVKRIEDLYGEIGYVAARINTSYDYLEEAGVVLLNVDVTENQRSRFGRITIRGNTRTKDEVVRRELRFYPGEDYNTVEARRAERRLLDTALFNRATIAPLEDVGGFREALVEVEEADTVNFLIGVGVSTDSGVLGSLSIDNRNFDLFDWPRTWGEFFRGQAFRGDGQRLLFQLEPGTELSRFRISFTEPYLLDKPLRYDLSFYLFQRGRESYAEERLGLTTSLSKRFVTGPLEGWAIEGALRIEAVNISNLRTLVCNDIRDVKGDSFITSVKGTIVRDTTDSRLIPTEGYRLAVGWEQAGALGGDYDFGKPSASFAAYKTVRTDVFDRKSVLAARADIAYIVGDAPVFERFYGGGFGSIRGFDFQGVTPRAGLFNDRVGGKFILLTGGEYSVPIYGKNIRGVTFIDMGTVEEEFEITSWRVGVGFGLRVVIDFLGPVPMVFDFGFPIASDDQDDTRVFNFSFGASF
ncbi:MAG: outer membrane protein assembly factor BamA, partial [Planctomycetes bacterium]|nr:outer membrane protein assembly factor BamA [Planctomycetota bacterium]